MCLQNISIFVSKIGLFGHYLEIASLDFADFAYYIRQEWYLTDLGGSSSQKKYLRLLWTIKACLQIIRTRLESLWNQHRQSVSPSVRNKSSHISHH